MWSFVGLKSKALIIAVGIAVAISVIAGSYIKGRMDGRSIATAEYAAEKATWERLVSSQQKKHEVVVAELKADFQAQLDKYQEQIAKLQDNPKIVTRIVNRYVPVETACTIPQGFVDLHNLAASGSTLDGTPQDASKPTEKTLADVGTVVAENYYQCNAVIDQLNALQQIVNDFQRRQSELTK